MPRAARVHLAALLVLMAVPYPSSAEEPASPAGADPAARLVGVWGSERVFGPEVRGELTLVRDGNTWQARIAGFEVAGRLEKGTLSVVLPGGQGEFRGTLSPNGQKLRGHWIQPKVIVGGTRYATPVELHAIQKDVWRGDVVPLDDRFTLYLVIQQATDGTLRAFLRNPEKNFGSRLSLRVSLTGTTLRLVDPQQPNMAFEGTYDEASERLTLPILFLGPLDFTRRDRNQASGLHARTPAPGPYSYRKPIAEADGWATASLSEVGIDPRPITTLVQRILDTESGPGAAPAIHGLLIARHGKLVLEEYFQGFDKERPHDLRSASKTFAPVLIGIAIDQGASLRAESPVYPLFPEYRGTGQPDPRKSALTVEHLMTMTSGFACDDNNDDSPGNENRLQDQKTDWYQYTLELPLEHAPGGENAVYCSAGINLLGGVLRNTTRAWVPEFFERTLATPLQMRRYHINLMPAGDAYLGGGLYMRPRDALKLGQLYLAGGVWNGKRVVSKNWVERSTAHHTNMSAERTYGYAWWRHDIRVGDRTYAEYEAGGNGGQFVMVVPELDLTVVFTGGNYGQFPVWKKFREELLPQFILSAIQTRR
ncbi:serine hydrolase domain-containing protein [Archangium violaceum]|uniref:serine hydrolase domain-containing protein n=1 Tax=Archangium violaceum TaxID=83451 RepID=UPI0036D8E0BC